MPRAPAPFDQAVQAVIHGREGELASLLAVDPALAVARSPAPHRATLLHYVAANGVEDELQRTPPNAVAICRQLLAAGAAPDALSVSYGGGNNQTPLCLLVSSGHPAAAGVQRDLLLTLVQGGAAVDGLDGDGMPMATALVFGYSSAARALEEAGARVDNLYFASGLGRTQQVESCFEQGGALRDGALATYRSPMGIQPPVTSRGRVQEALHFAVSHGQREVASTLLARGADPNGTVVGHHCETPLLQALFVGQKAMARFLFDRGADPTRRDGKRGTTPLAYATSDPELHDAAGWFST